MGYLLAYELCDYDASICPYMMADQLSMFFEMQGAMVGLIFLASNYYIWLSMVNAYAFARQLSTRQHETTPHDALVKAVFSKRRHVANELSAVHRHLH